MNPPSVNISRWTNARLASVGLSARNRMDRWSWGEKGSRRATSREMIEASRRIMRLAGRHLKSGDSSPRARPGIPSSGSSCRVMAVVIVAGRLATESTERAVHTRRLETLSEFKSHPPFATTLEGAREAPLTSLYFPSPLASRHEQAPLRTALCLSPPAATSRQTDPVNLASPWPSFASSARPTYSSRHSLRPLGK